MEKLTIDKVAKLAHVSRSVVSRVLNNHTNVSNEARERVVNIVKKYEYSPNSAARSLVTNHTYEIGIFVTRKGTEELGSGFWTLIHLGIFDECIRHGYFVRLSFIYPHSKDEIQNFILKSRQLDGIILLTQETTGIVMEALHNGNLPTVIEGHNSDYPDISSVDVDNFAGSYEGTTHLIRLGHTKIAAIFANPDIQESVDRMDGYKQAMFDAGLHVQEDSIAIGDYSQKFGFSAVQNWIKGGLDFSAVLCASDTLAMGAMLALYKAGINVPGQVSVIGFDDLPFAQYTVPPLTTIRQSIYAKGKRLAQILISELKEENKHVVHENLKPELVIRESCGRCQLRV